MHVTIDSAGRIVVPKPLRDELGLEPGTQLALERHGNTLQLTAPDAESEIVEGPNGPVIRARGNVITDEHVREALDAIRERR
jgi:AbrB family looped-hinge helix DNA binding protein